VALAVKVMVFWYIAVLSLWRRTLPGFVVRSEMRIGVVLELLVSGIECSD
jgi:hypothetical protein